MAKYDPDKHHRRSIRLQGYNYRQGGAYFITIVTYVRECTLGQVKDGMMALSAYGSISEQSWRSLPRHFTNIELDAFIVMPNHIHGIVFIYGGTSSWAERQGEAFGAKDGNTSLKAPNASPLHGTARRASKGTTPGSLGAIVQSFKSTSTRRINKVRKNPGTPFWQRNYYEHVIRNEDDLNNIRQYILHNPAQWLKDDENPNAN
jgi:putative transposase